MHKAQIEAAGIPWRYSFQFGRGICADASAHEVQLDLGDPGCEVDPCLLLRSKSIFVTDAIGAAANVSRCGRVMPRPMEKLIATAIAMESCLVTMTHPVSSWPTNRPHQLVAKFRCCAYASARTQNYLGPPVWHYPRALEPRPSIDVSRRILDVPARWRRRRRDDRHRGGKHERERKENERLHCLSSEPAHL
jgi:hypothetical protein